MNGITRNKLSKIHYFLSEAQEVWDQLSEIEQGEIHELHNEQFSLDYCLRWGISAANDARDYAEGR